MFNGLRNIKTIAGVVLNRTELYARLVAVETKIEMALMVRRLIWAATSVVFSLCALAMLHIAVLSYFWFTEQRMVATGALLFVDIAIAGAALYMASKIGQQESFMVTKKQLEKDIEFVKESV